MNITIPTQKNIDEITSIGALRTLTTGTPWMITLQQWSTILTNLVQNCTSKLDVITQIVDTKWHFAFTDDGMMLVYTGKTIPIELLTQRWAWVESYGLSTFSNSDVTMLTLALIRTTSQAIWSMMQQFETIMTTGVIVDAPIKCVHGDLTRIGPTFLIARDVLNTVDHPENIDVYREFTPTIGGDNLATLWVDDDTTILGSVNPETLTVAWNTQDATIPTN